MKQLNWLQLPSEVMSMILQKVGAIEIFQNVQYVCSSWRKLCEDPLMWRTVDMRISGNLPCKNYYLRAACRYGVDLSRGHLIAISIESFATDSLLLYIARRSNELKRLWIADCLCISDLGLIKAASKLPLLEQLEIVLCCFDAKTLGTVGRCCPLLKSLKLNQQFCTGKGMVCDREALAIAKTMPKLRHLQIFGNALTDRGLQAILNGCPDLESLDLRHCFNLKFEGQLGNMCAEKIKILHLPHDSTDDYEFNTEIIDWGGDDFEDYPYDLPHDDEDSDNYSYDDVDDDDGDNDEDDPWVELEKLEKREVVCTICHPLVLV